MLYEIKKLLYLEMASRMTALTHEARITIGEEPGEEARGREAACARRIVFIATSVAGRVSGRRGRRRVSGLCFGIIGPRAGFERGRREAERHGEKRGAPSASVNNGIASNDDMAAAGQHGHHGNCRPLSDAYRPDIETVIAGES